MSGTVIVYAAALTGSGMAWENAGEKESRLYGLDPAPAVGGDLREELGRRGVEEYGDILRHVTGYRDWGQDSLVERCLRSRFAV